MQRSQYRVFALVWLAIVFVLADLAMGLLRTLSIAPVATGLLVAALQRAQVSLLLVWLALGTEPLRWRLMGFVAGMCIQLIIFTRLLLPIDRWNSFGSPWLELDWLEYFLPTGPGDVLVKLPLLIPGILVPLVAWRFIRRSRNIGHGQDSRDQRNAWFWCQFSFQDAIVFFLTISFVLAVMYTISPYPGWHRDVLEYCFGTYQSLYLSLIPNGESSVAVFITATAGLYVSITLLSVWAVYARRALLLRATFLVLATMAGALAADLLRSHSTKQTAPIVRIAFDEQAESLTAPAFLLLVVAALQFYRVHATQVELKSAAGSQNHEFS